jgi:hypothetical protein
MESIMTWDDVFTTKNIEGKSDRHLCAIGLCAWGNCHAGSPAPDSFGEVITMIADKLGISGQPESFMKKAKEFTNEPKLTPERKRVIAKWD